MQVEGRQVSLGFGEAQRVLGAFNTSAAISRLMCRIAKLAFEIFYKVVNILESIVAIKVLYTLQNDDSARVRLARLFSIAPIIPNY